MSLCAIHCSRLPAAVTVPSGLFHPAARLQPKLCRHARQCPVHMGIMTRLQPLIGLPVHPLGFVARAVENPHLPAKWPCLAHPVGSVLAAQRQADYSGNYETDLFTTHYPKTREGLVLPNPRAPGYLGTYSPPGRYLILRHRAPSSTSTPSSAPKPATQRHVCLLFV